MFSRRDADAGATGPGSRLKLPAEAADSVQQARTRARHRLIGAAVLVALALVVFPLVFETEPRRVPIDIPIEIVRQDAVSTRAASPTPVARNTPSGQEAAAAPSPAAVTQAARSPEPVSEPVLQPPKIITETAADAGREIPRPTAAASTPRVAAARREAAPEPPRAKPVATPVKSASPPVKPPSPSETRSAEKAPAAEALGDGVRAQLLLEGKEDAKPDVTVTARYVVQVGAFADGPAAHDMRSKVERLGLKTYTQVGQTPAGARTRVRVGPVATRAEAERMQAKLKAAGIPAVVLAL